MATHRRAAVSAPCRAEAENSVRLEAVELLDEGAAARLTWADGESALFHAVWLRDNALDPATRNSANGQRLMTLLDIPPDISIAAASIMPDGDLELAFRPEEKRVTYSSSWLRQHRYDREPAERRGWIGPAAELWDNRLFGALPMGIFAEIAADRRALGPSPIPISACRRTPTIRIPILCRRCSSSPAWRTP
jgi:[2-(trimethylamino)ethyl]phosphonate dioxygenase